MATTSAAPQPQEKTLEQIHLDAAIGDLTNQVTEASQKRALLTGEIAKRDAVIKQLATENETLRKKVEELTTEPEATPAPPASKKQP